MNQPGDCCLIDGWDCPRSDVATAELCTILAIEEGYATFCGALLNSVLTHYWDQVRTGLVEESNSPVNPDAKSDEAANPPKADATAKPDEQPGKTTHCGAAFIHLAEDRRRPGMHHPKRRGNKSVRRNDDFIRQRHDQLGDHTSSDGRI